VIDVTVQAASRRPECGKTIDPPAGLANDRAMLQG
jgi:hypothetical protein